ncbi:MAG TPA: cellulase family glycosylhydrolase [Burkholderiales bacterium]|nr:cellulase family glycosylhydrolase [Burkholderiales bacterium]
MTYPANHMLGSQRNGLNHVSMNMGSFDRVAGPIRGTNYPLYADALLNWYQAKHVSSARLMFTWEAVQSTLGGPVPPAGPGYANYWTDLVSVLTRLLARGVYVTLAPWQFNAASDDTDIVYDNAPVTPGAFANFWGKLAAAINGVTGNDQRVAFDLLNEPHTHAESGNKSGDIGISLADWFTCAQAAINAIRAAGATNTIFVPGMAYTAASSFTTNGSAAQWLALTDPQNNIAVTVHCYSGLGSVSSTVLRNACSALVTWARTNGVKVHIGEIAIDAGPNGRPTHCSTFAMAQAQWADWNKFCIANDDVLVGWNWWANSAPGWWNQGDSCDPQGFHWGLTLDNGATQTVYMNLIQGTLAVPALYIRDNAADTGSEPNATTTVGWESPDVWVRQSADGITVGEPILGGQPSVVYVSVTNKGGAPYPDGGSDIVRLYWAKAETGLSWPAPWNGSIPKQGKEITPFKPVGAILPAQSAPLQFDWADTPNPADYANDGHFCLLAFVTKATSLQFEGFQGPDLNQNVLKLSKVAWRNIHIVPVAKMENMGDMVVANHTDRNMAAQVAFEILDAGATPIHRARGNLFITPRGAALDKLREDRAARRFLEDMGDGTFRVLDIATGIPHLDLRPEEALPFALAYVPDREVKGYAVRVTQFSLDGASRKPIGGQTFVAGEVEGFTTRRARRRGGSYWPWAIAAGSLLLLLALLGRDRDR